MSNSLFINDPLSLDSLLASLLFLLWVVGALLTEFAGLVANVEMCGILTESFFRGMIVVCLSEESWLTGFDVEELVTAFFGWQVVGLLTVRGEVVKSVVVV